MEDRFNWISLDDKESERNSSGLPEIPYKTRDGANDIIECAEQTMNKPSSVDFLFQFNNRRKVFVQQTPATCMDCVTCVHEKKCLSLKKN